MREVPCSLCRANDYAIVFPATLPGAQHDLSLEAFRCTSVGYGVHHRIVRCRRCGLTYASPRYDGRPLLEKYQAVEDPLYLQERPGRVLTFERHMRSLERVAGPANGRRLLDVGAYTGVFVEIAGQAGWDAQGLEPSEWAVGVAQQDGLRVQQGTLADAQSTPESFDVLTMWDVIEHFPDPRAELERSFRLLAAGGMLVVHTIDIGSLTAQLMGSRWPFLMEMHLVYFTRRTLRAMLERAGFRVHSVHTAGRYLSLGYLAGRLGAAFGPAIGRTVEAAVGALGLQHKAVPVNTLDLFTMYAVKPAAEN